MYFIFLNILRLSGIIRMKWILLVLILPGLTFASENCTMLGGVCRDSCTENEIAEAGAFIDCAANQECCAVREEQEAKELRCCIYSFGTSDFGTRNCGIPKENKCEKGTASALECSKLDYCKETKK
jgi:hypothetical protein